MPINEILAPCYVLVKYHTSHNHPHVFRMYFDAVPVADGDGVFSFPTYTDGGHLTGWRLDEIIAEVMDRAALATTQMPGLDIDQVEVWRTEVGANIFMGLDGGNYAPISGGVATSIAAAYWMLVFKSASRQQYRLMFMDAGDAKPQRTPYGVPPAVDDGFLAWFFINSAVGFVTQDNEPLTYVGSTNTGYNRKLARSYGRMVTP